MIIHTENIFINLDKVDSIKVDIIADYSEQQKDKHSKTYWHRISISINGGSSQIITKAITEKEALKLKPKVIDSIKKQIGEYNDNKN